MPIGSAHWVADGMVRSLRNLPPDNDGVEGFAFDVANQFFHAGRPLGWMRSFTLEVDGAEIDPGVVTFELHGQPIPAASLPQIDEIWWQPCDVATLIVKGRRLAAGSHQITWRFRLPLINFTPVVDRLDIYPTFETSIEAVLDVADEAEAVR